MATLPFLLIGLWLCNIFINHFDKKIQDCKEIDKMIKELRKPVTDSKPKYQMKEENIDDEDLFFTDLGKGIGF